MNYRRISPICGIIIVILAAFPPGGMAQRRPELSGELEYEQEEEQSSSYSVAQDSAIAYFRSISEQLGGLRDLGTAHLEKLPDQSVQFLTAVYLYCSVKQGTCALPLDALLESDIIDAKLRSSATCPNLTRFWKIWLKNDMEKRHQYLVKIGHLYEVDQFKRDKRPRYIRCKDTVEKEMAASNGVQAYFKDRYAEGSEAASNILKMVKFLEELKSQVPNVYGATGIAVEGSAASLPEKKKGGAKPAGRKGSSAGAKKKSL